MRLHSAAGTFFHAHAGQLASHAFMGRIAHTMYNAMIYSTLYRIMRHVPLPIAIALVVAIAIIGYRRAQNTGRAPW
ncbi:hypothetical protein [Gluconacetobacter takamatsuzukensis]|uniref:Uncharacterized protein n=1 Tax=Gluconacetobacter takamatsuzukensis TaxID=1286190 RepID=A0A7W4KF03_9PROT|nr:hypothetical protein [Gluconacetobacter takamatsuzukensis]MBB2205722.1 hypothetical protein [Gluconacetobacter takamatsuzukensis]